MTGHTIISDRRDSLELWPEPAGLTARLEAETPHGVTVLHLTVEDLRELARASVATAATLADRQATL